METFVIKWICVFSAVARCLGDDATYVDGFYSNTPQVLSKYSSYGNARMYHFQVPAEVEFARWTLTALSKSAFNCDNQNITVHFRCGAPPVINPLLTAVPNFTIFSLSYNLTMSVSNGQSSSVTVFNVTHPEAGDWFLAAHLPKDDGKISQQGLPSCQFLFQPQMFLRRAVDAPVLQENVPVTKTLSVAQKGTQFRLFVPEFSTRMNIFIDSCSVGGAAGGDCGLTVTLGSVSLGESSVISVNCSGTGTCSSSVSSPPWNTWVRVTVERRQSNAVIAFRITANYTVGCKPVSLPSDSNASVPLSSAPDANSCMRIPSILREELDIFSVRFTVANGSMKVDSNLLTMLVFDLEHVDSGGTLSIQLDLNMSSLIGAFDSVRACVTPSAPVLQLNTSTSCDSAFLKGYSLQLRANQTTALLRVPFPQALTWYLSLQTICNSSSDCSNTSAKVKAAVSVTACVDNCGSYGDCSLLRTSGYLYTACVCSAGWQGWSCSDDTNALSFSRQLAAVLLLTLSNLFFIPPIVVALHRGYYPEATVYLFTMFFSTFYHACDQPGVTVMCIMNYDTLQYCDFLGSVVAVWVTIICMARLKELFKYVFFMGGTLLIAMAMQLDRRGLWNLLGPVLFSLVVMVTAWVYRSVRRRHCYPPTWKRWVFFLIPGIVSAVIGLCVYAFAQTDSNYYYTHSIWHVMVATSVVFLLPPREHHMPPWGWAQRLCGYKLCQNQKDDLHVVS